MGTKKAERWVSITIELKEGEEFTTWNAKTLASQRIEVQAENADDRLVREVRESVATIINRTERLIPTPVLEETDPVPVAF